MEYDRRRSGFHGPALLSPVAEVGLIVGDRLEPNRLLKNVGLFEEIYFF